MIHILHFFKSQWNHKSTVAYHKHPVSKYPGEDKVTLQWRHNGRNSVSNHQPHDCLLNRLFRRRSKKTSKLRVTGLCVGNSPGTGEFPAQKASYAENVSIWWRHHELTNVWWRYLGNESDYRKLALVSWGDVTKKGKLFRKIIHIFFNTH